MPNRRTKQRQQAREAVIKNIDACKELSTVTRTSLGPNATNRIIIKHQQDKLFLNELEIEHPAAKLLVLAGKEQQKKFGDGVNLVVSIAWQHLEGAKELITMGLSPSEIIKGYTKASNKLGEILEALVEEGSETMDVRNKDQVILRMKAPVASKQYEKEDILCPLIAEACIQVCPENPVNFNVDNVRVAKLLGTCLGDSKTFRGMVLKVDSVVGSIKRIEKAKVLVIDGGVDEQLGNYAKTEVEELIKESGAKVIVSGAAVGEMALHFCDRNEIMVLIIASKFELECFCRTTNAVALLKLGSTVNPDDIGYVDSISVKKTRGAMVTVTNEQGGVATVLLGAITNSISDELERAVVTGINTYKAFCRDSRIVPGAGATEIEIARQLKEFAFTETGSSIRMQSQNATYIISTLYEEHKSGNVKVGIDLREGACKDASTLNIWDLYTTKYHALQYAADAVCNALRVDQARELVEPQSIFDRLMSEHHVSGGQYFWQHELPAEKLIYIFYESIRINKLQPKREMERLAVKSHGDKLFGLSRDGKLSSFDIRSSEVCWSIRVDMDLDLDFSYKSSENNCSYFVDSSRVFRHTIETNPVDYGFHVEVFEEPFTYFDEEIVPSKSLTQIYVDPVEGCRISPLMYDCDEILCIRAIHAQLTSYKPGTNIVLRYERVATFSIWIVSWEEGLLRMSSQSITMEIMDDSMWKLQVLTRTMKNNPKSPQQRVA
ncbi:TCP-1/cpn60 chaperonin family protein [Artemisia annua]|uniref:TCP-1/cpn60 chaperonin family protein n=1 Tax=Artemisia annua TaxID=35608 RepID=A0A2U1QG51_ARTAN|nr:TCP-1/cpn60 chaperonin family protein [Artemisia annua]